jgi:hypothetical protein
MSYESRIDAKDVEVIEAMKLLSAQYPRYGYRKIRIFLSREGHVMCPGRAERLRRKAKPRLPPKGRGKPLGQPVLDRLGRQQHMPGFVRKVARSDKHRQLLRRFAAETPSLSCRADDAR